MDELLLQYKIENSKKNKRPLSPQNDTSIQKLSEHEEKPAALDDSQ